MEVYLINLDRSPERLEASAQQLRQFGLPFNRIRAIDGTSDNFKMAYFIDVENYLRSINGPLYPGEVACGLSHKLALDEFLESSSQMALILEDDGVFSHGFVAQLKTIGRMKFTQPTVIKLANHKNRFPIRLRNVNTSLEFQVNCGKTTSAGAYVVNRDGAIKLRAALDPSIYDRAIDAMIDQWWRYGFITLSVVAPFATYVDRRQSLIVDESIAARCPRANHVRVFYRLKEIIVDLKRIAFGLTLILKVRIDPDSYFGSEA